MQKHCICALAAISLALSCAGDDHDHDHDHDHDNEVISRVVLTFTPDGGGDPLSFQFDDPDGDGGVSGTSDRVELDAGTAYTLSLSFENALVDPLEDITEEIEGEAEEHIILISGDLSGPGSTPAMALLTHAYGDQESDYGANAVGEDLPVGLVNTITATTAGNGELRITLRHLPDVDGAPQKSASIPADFAAGMDLAGSVDVDLTFELVVSEP